MDENAELNSQDFNEEINLDNLDDIYDSSYSEPVYFGFYEVFQNRKFIYALIIFGIFLLILGMLRTPKLDPKISALFKDNPEKEISVLVFCKTCSNINGEIVEPGKIILVDKVSKIKELTKDPDVIQIRYLGD